MVSVLPECTVALLANVVVLRDPPRHSLHQDTDCLRELRGNGEKHMIARDTVVQQVHLALIQRLTQPPSIRIPIPYALKQNTSVMAAVEEMVQVCWDEVTVGPRDGEQVANARRAAR